MTSRYREVNFDGLVGPTHHYAGLSRGNKASTLHGGEVSNPREAALQGLDKMWALAQRGYMQAVIPPLMRPDLSLLRNVGFVGSDAHVLLDAQRDERAVLCAAFSASSMWAANMATVSPSPDTRDGRLHLTPANLNTKLHRSQEHLESAEVLQAIFAGSEHFAVHRALVPTGALGDEGAANHMRFAGRWGDSGVEVFVYGRSEFDHSSAKPQRYQARQTLEASRAVARKHGLATHRTVFLQQNPLAVDAGVFHNDVIAVNHRDVLFYHQEAFVDEDSSLDHLAAVCSQAGFELHKVRVSNSELGLEDVVRSYLFNSQLLDLPEGGMLLVVPSECNDNARVRAYLGKLLASGSPIREVVFLDLRQSMRNGGGPACLRLRVVLSDEQLAAVRGRVFMDHLLHSELCSWVSRHYRQRLTAEDFADPHLLIEIDDALVELEGILELPGLYSRRDQRQTP